ncbi:MAG: FecR domain-containing protein [Candidatus Magnetoovum sp. WYHC-5]|nr:FecR domain-containing protein [Candidatus Magnetoovum sp. WYHC-5]
MRKLVVGLFLLMFVVPLWAEDTAIVGEVKKVKGDAKITHTGQPINAQPGSKIYTEDILKTGKDSAMSFTLKDSTVLSLGPNSELAVKDFKFVPSDKKLSLITKMMKGSASYISGTIGKLSPESVKFETPDATIGIRGTKFLVKVNE